MCFLGYPIGGIRQLGACASAVILPELSSTNIVYTGLEKRLRQIDKFVYLLNLKSQDIVV